MQIPLGYDPKGPSEPIDIVSSRDGWSEYTLADGTVIRTKCALLDVKQMVGQYNAEGEPIYVLQMTMINQARVPDQLKKTLYQHVYGRIPHQVALAEAVDGTECHHFTELARRAMDAMGLDYQVVFPTPMLLLGMHPQDDIEVALGRAYDRWLVERILPEDERLKGLLYLPFNTPRACLDVIREFGDAPGVIGFTVCATRNKPVHHDSYMKLYSAIEETGKPLAFHSGFHWGDPSFLQLNRFISMHALSFVHYSLIHLANWVINGLPERFPKLKLVWVESGVAWVPFIMQRLDHEFMMRVCEAPMLKRLPSEYIREMICRRP
jgi:predicted TIM-barrel fold metal-dependent hydrolase